MSKQKILITLAQLRAGGIAEPSRSMVAVLTGLKLKSLNTLAGPLKKQGHVVYPSAKTIAITENGLQQVPRDVAVFKPLSVQDTLNYVKTTLKLGNSPIRILQALLESGIPRMSKKDLAGLVGMSDDAKYKSFKTYLSALSSKKLVEYPTPDMVCVSKLFRSMLPPPSPPSSPPPPPAAAVTMAPPSPAVTLLEQQPSSSTTLEEKAAPIIVYEL